uniref:Reverse transcriptase/retrotransposon-derived protein RNase H-like domain-containing protein n=1 Tax=Fagus sylvatica TaxID=28930 RepID=A0A2N9F606_FAGSY
MEGVNNEGINTDPPMTPIERQMQVIATSIQDLARETTRQSQELWQAIRKEPPTPPRPLGDDQPPPQGENMREDQETDEPSSRPSNTHPPKALTLKEPTENHRPGPVGEIRTIIGRPYVMGNIMCFKKSLRMTEDVRGTHQPHDDALVITMNIAGFTTRRVMVDNSSSADILYLPAYQQMKLDKDKLRPMDAPLVGFTGDKVCPVNIVTLPITIGTYPKIVSKTVDFLIVNCPSAYNAIIRRPTLNRLLAVTSTYHLLIKFPTEYGIGEVRGDQVVARECYLASLGSEWQNQTMKIEEQKTLVKPSEELDTINLEEECPEKATKVGANLPPQMKESIVQILKNNNDVFAWSHEDMSGIEANPDKIKAILDMQPPKTTKEVQGLTGRVAALNRFVSRSTDKCLPFSKTLKKAFTWTDECQQAFEELKSHLTTPLLLSPSKQGEELYLYLVVSPTAVSSALVREENRWQLPIYYTSRALRGAEESEFDVNYRPRTAIKAQTLADFMVEFTVKDNKPKEEEERDAVRWTIHTYGSSTKNAGGVGIILKSPEGDVIKRAIRLQYTTTKQRSRIRSPTDQTKNGHNTGSN